MQAQDLASGINTFKPIICCEFSANTSCICEKLMCHDSLCSMEAEGGRKRCSSTARPHLLFMTHRKSFSLSSRWYPGSKHIGEAIRTQASMTVCSQWKGAGFVAGCVAALMSSRCHFGCFLFHCFLRCFFFPLFLSFSEVYQNSHRPDRSVRGCGIVCVSGHWEPEACRLLEQEGQEGQLPAHWGGCHSEQFSLFKTIAAWRDK